MSDMLFLARPIYSQEKEVCSTVRDVGDREVQSKERNL